MTYDLPIYCIIPRYHDVETSSVYSVHTAVRVYKPPPHTHVMESKMDLRYRDVRPMSASDTGGVVRGILIKLECDTTTKHSSVVRNHLYDTLDSRDPSSDPHTHKGPKSNVCVIV